MKVKELIEKLKKCNLEAEVIGYNSFAEDDFIVKYVDNNEPLEESDVYYCQGDSNAADYIDQPVVYLYGN